MESGPFSRKSWVTQSLRITAKELSLVGGKGKSNAIAERFSKYQKAAEDSSAEKKKSHDGASASLRSGNLSALKKRWEQVGTHDKDKPPAAPTPSQPRSRVRPPALTRLPSVSEQRPPAKSPGLLNKQGRQKAATRVEKTPAAAAAAAEAEAEAAAPVREEQKGMDKDEPTVSRRPEKLDEQVPTSPRASYEKPRVQLNNLKKKFEMGEDAVAKGGRTTLRSTSSEDMDQHSSSPVSDRALDSSSLREKMAKYQAAATKQGATRSGVASDKSAPKTPAPVNGQHAPATECNGESTEAPKASRKFCPPARETCSACSKTVYPLERLVAHQQLYHKRCFRCVHCNTNLSLGNYASLHGSIYCKPHFSQLFKSKGNYDEGFGHRPHKELWESRAEGDESDEAVKPKEREEAARAPRPTESSPEVPPPPAEASPPVKVTDLTALLARAGSAEKKQSAEKPAETRRLRVAWPPPAGEVHGGTAAPSAATEGVPSNRARRGKWPPDDEAPASFQSTERAELKSLRRSSSLKERIRPFTIAAKPAAAPSAGPREPRRPLKSLLEWRASFEEKQASKESPREDNPDVTEAKQEKKRPKPREDAGLGRQTITEEEVPSPRKPKEEKVRRGEAAAERKAAEGGALRSPSPEPSPSPTWQPKQDRTSQDVGFWEEDKVGSDAEELSAEDIIKRNRYYEEEDEEENCES